MQGLRGPQEVLTAGWASATRSILLLTPAELGAGSWQHQLLQCLPLPAHLFGVGSEAAGPWRAAAGAGSPRHLLTPT